MADISDYQLKVLAFLKENSSLARRLIAQRLKTSEPTLSKTISSLEQNGVIGKFSINIDYGKLGYNVHAITLMIVKDLEHVEKLISRLNDVTEVIELHTALGEKDIYIRWLCRDSKDISDHIYSSIKDLSIIKSETIILSQVHKNTYGLDLTRLKANR